MIPLDPPPGGRVSGSLEFPTFALLYHSRVIRQRGEVYKYRALETPMSDRFAASRWISGNMFFPTIIEVSRERVLRIKPRALGSNEESIAIQKVASVNISTGLIFS